MLLSVAAAACGDSPPTAPASQLTISILGRGNGSASNGVVVTVVSQGRSQIRRVEIGGSVTVDVSPGSVDVSVSDLPSHCWADETTTTVEYVEGMPSDATLEVTCVGEFAYRTGRLDEVAYLGSDGELTTHLFPGAISVLSWSPAGHAVLVARWSAPKCSMSLFHVGTGSVTSVGSPDFSYAWGHPAWSETGDRLVLGRTRDCGSPNEVALMLFDGSGTTVLDSVPGLLPSAAAWRPGTQEIVYAAGTQARRRSWAQGWDSLFVDMDGDVLEWSPAGNRLAYQLTPVAQIAIFDGDGQELFRLGGDGYAALEPVWAADGSGLLFSCIPPGIDWDICYASADGSDVRSVTPQPGTGNQPSWAADGDYFLYTWRVDGYVSVFLGNILGLPHRDIVNVSGTSEARFRPGAELGLD